MSDVLATGWDVGGAHLKVAQADAAGRLALVAQEPCRLWLGLHELLAAIERLRPRLAPSPRHAMTMTGELADVFPDRAAGVAALAAAMAEALARADLLAYAGPLGLVPLAQAAAHVREVSSANWHASARLAAERLGAGLLVDVGSTTTDVVPFADGRVAALAWSDEERLGAEELVYTGVTRTPVMALGDRVPFAGARQPLMAELFATAADVHRLTGELAAGADQHPPADGRGTSDEESAGRLARMLGRDRASAPMAHWRGLARHLAERQRRLVADAIERALSRGLLGDDAPLVGAGVGRFLLAPIAQRLRLPYRDAADLLDGPPEAREWGARCLPAAATALLALRPARLAAERVDVPAVLEEAFGSMPEIERPS